MSAIVKEVYDAFRSAGVSDEQAAAAALAIPPRNELVTKTDVADLRSEFAELKIDFAKLRRDVKSDITELRTEFNGKLTELRTEARSDTMELRSELRELRAETRGDMKDLEMRLTLRFFAAVGLAVAGIKALDFLIG